MKNRKELKDKNSVGAKITALRKATGMKQKELLAKLQSSGIDIGQSALSDLEGQKRKVSADELKALAEIFQISADELLRSRDEEA